ncbi:MAG: AAA family ATPase [Dehalococcoidia bacterium]
MRASSLVRTSFVGRDAESATLDQAVTSAIEGAGSVALITGEPGIGKTRLVEQASEGAQAKGARVLWGRCYEGDGAPPFWPWVQILRDYLHGQDPAGLFHEIGADRSVIAQVVPELSDGSTRLLSDSEAGAQARFRLFETITTVLHFASSRVPLVLVLDDLHWADEASLKMLEYLATQGRLGSARILALGTYRDTEASPESMVAQSAARVARGKLSARIALTGLERDSVRALFHQATGITPADQLVDTVLEKTDGNPLFVGETIRILAADGMLQAKGGAAIAVPPGVREAIDLRLARLAPDTVALLRQAAVFGRDFRLRHLELATGRRGDDILEALEPAEQARTVATVGPGEYRFAHALIQETLVAGLSMAGRARAHLRAAEALEQAGSASYAELAHHFLQAAPLGTTARAISCLARAAADATASLAYEAARDHYLRAIDVDRQYTGAASAEAPRLLLGLGEAYRRLGDISAANATFVQAAERGKDRCAAGDADGPEILAAAAIGRAGEATFDHYDSEAIALLDDASAAFAGRPAPAHAIAISALARVTHFTPARHAESAALAHRAVAMARDLGDRRALAHTLEGGIVALGIHSPHRLRHAEELITLGREVGDRDALAEGYLWAAREHLWHGRPVEMRAAVDRYRALAKDLRMPQREWHVLGLDALEAQIAGDWPEAERLMFAGLQLGQQIGSTNALQFWAGQMMFVRHAQGRLAELEPILLPLAARSPEVPLWRAALAAIHHQAGKHDEAAADVRMLAERGFEQMPKINALPIVFFALGDALVHNRLAGEAARVEAVASEWAGCVVYGGQASMAYGPVDFLLGQCAEAQGHVSHAVDLYNRAIATDVAFGARSWEAVAQVRLGACLRGANADGSAAALSRARELGEAHGLRAVLADVEAILATPPPSAVTATPRHPAGLSEREVEVLRLLAGGLSNREIADKLVISPNTVMRHITSIYGKAACTNRADAGRFAAKHGLV